MALAVPQVTGKDGPASATVTTNAITTASGSLLVAFATGFNISGTPVNGWVTDSKSNTWTYVAAASTISGAFEGVGMWYQLGGTRGASHTITFTPTGANNCNLHVIEITGHDTSTPFDTTTAATGLDTSSPWGATASAAISGNQIALCAVAVADNGDGTWTNPAGYSDIYEQGTSSQRTCAGAWYKINETGTPNPTATFSNAGGTAHVSFATFKEGVGGEPPSPDFVVPFRRRQQPATVIR